MSHLQGNTDEDDLLASRRIIGRCRDIVITIHQVLEILTIRDIILESIGRSKITIRCNEANRTYAQSSCIAHKLGLLLLEPDTRIYNLRIRCDNIRHAVHAVDLCRQVLRIHLHDFLNVIGLRLDEAASYKIKSSAQNDCEDKSCG